MRTYKDLNSLVEARAKQKLLDDLADLSQKILGNSLMRPVTSARDEENAFPRLGLITLVNDQRKFEDMTTEKLFGCSKQKDTVVNESQVWGYYLKQLYMYWLPIYIERESRSFMEAVDRMQKDVNYLLDN